MPLPCQQLLDRAPGRGLPGTRGTFDHHEAPFAGQDPDHCCSGRVDPDQAAPADAGVAGWLSCGSCNPNDDVGLDLEDLWRAERADVLGHIAPVQQWDAPVGGAGGDVFGELDADRGVCDQAGLGDENLGRPMDGGAVPGRPLRPENGDDQLGGGFAVDPPRPRPRQRHGSGRVAVAELAQLVVPAGNELPAVDRDNLVRPGLRPGPPVPPLPQPRTGLLAGVLGPPGGLVAVDVAADLRGPGAESPDVRRQLLDLAVSGSSVNPCAASAARNPGSVATAACPIPLIASIESRIPTECSPRHAPAAHTRALICRWRCRCGSPAREV
jgi:hypothetical protein